MATTNDAEVLAPEAVNDEAQPKASGSAVSGFDSAHDHFGASSSSEIASGKGTISSVREELTIATPLAGITTVDEGVGQKEKQSVPVLPMNSSPYREGPAAAESGAGLEAAVEPAEQTSDTEVTGKDKPESIAKLGLGIAAAETETETVAGERSECTEPVGIINKDPGEIHSESAEQSQATASTHIGGESTGSAKENATLAPNKENEDVNMIDLGSPTASAALSSELNALAPLDNAVKPDVDSGSVITSEEPLGSHTNDVSSPTIRAMANDPSSTGDGDPNVVNSAGRVKGTEESPADDVETNVETASSKEGVISMGRKDEIAKVSLPVSVPESDLRDESDENTTAKDHFSKDLEAEVPTATAAEESLALKEDNGAAKIGNEALNLESRNATIEGVTETSTTVDESDTNPQNQERVDQAVSTSDGGAAGVEIPRDTAENSTFSVTEKAQESETTLTKEDTAGSIPIVDSSVVSSSIHNFVSEASSEPVNGNERVMDGDATSASQTRHAEVEGRQAADLSGGSNEDGIHPALTSETGNEDDENFVNREKDLEQRDEPVIPKEKPSTIPIQGVTETWSATEEIPAKVVEGVTVDATATDNCTTLEPSRELHGQENTAVMPFDGVTETSTSTDKGITKAISGVTEETTNTEGSTEGPQELHGEREHADAVLGAASET